MIALSIALLFLSIVFYHNLFIPSIELTDLLQKNRKANFLQFAFRIHQIVNLLNKMQPIEHKK